MIKVNPTYVTHLFSVLVTNVCIDTDKQLIQTSYAVSKLFIEPHFTSGSLSLTIYGVG